MALTEEQKREIEADEEIKIAIDGHSSDTYICTVCGYLGRPKNHTKGAFAFEVVLWLLFIIPGLLYSLWRITNKYKSCPKCNSTAIIPLDTPNGQAIYKSLHSQKYSREKQIDNEYRAQIREKLLKEHGTKKTEDNGFVYGLKSFLFSSKGALLIIVIAIVILVNILASQNSTAQSLSSTATTVSVTPTLIPAVKVAEGDFMNYHYEIAKREDADEYAAVFTPFLQRDDTVMTGAMIEIINKIYGKNTVVNLSPSIVERNGLNHFKFQATNGSYYVLPVKSDIGELLLLKFWKEQTDQHSLSTPTLGITANVGKHAYNKINGAYRGEILEVKACNSAPELTCYVVNQPTFMRPMEAPVDNSVVKNEAPTPPK